MPRTRNSFSVSPSLLALLALIVAGSGNLGCDSTGQTSFNAPVPTAGNQSCSVVCAASGAQGVVAATTGMGQQQNLAGESIYSCNPNDCAGMTGQIATAMSNQIGADNSNAASLAAATAQQSNFGNGQYGVPALGGTGTLNGGPLGSLTSISPALAGTGLISGNVTSPATAGKTTPATAGVVGGVGAPAGGSFGGGAMGGGSGSSFFGGADTTTAPAATGPSAGPAGMLTDSSGANGPAYSGGGDGSMQSGLFGGGGGGGLGSGLRSASNTVSGVDQGNSAVGVGEKVRAPASDESASGDGTGKSGPTGTAASADPADYFGFLHPHDSLFKEITRRYGQKTRGW